MLRHFIKLLFDLLTFENHHFASISALQPAKSTLCWIAKGNHWYWVGFWPRQLNTSRAGPKLSAKCLYTSLVHIMWSRVWWISCVFFSAGPWFSKCSISALRWSYEYGFYLDAAFPRSFGYHEEMGIPLIWSANHVVESAMYIRKIPRRWVQDRVWGYRIEDSELKFKLRHRTHVNPFF